MPTFRITDPNSGRTVSVTGDQPPSEQEIDQIFKNIPAPSTQQQAPTQPQHPVMNFLRSIGLGAVPDILGTAQFAAKEVGQGVNPLTGTGATPQKLADAAQGNLFLTPDQLNKTGGVGQAAKDLVGGASYAVPFGEGATIATKALLPGVVSGGLNAASQDSATPGSVVRGSLAGGAAAGVLSGLAKVLEPVLSKVGDAATTAGNKAISSQYAVTPSDRIALDAVGTTGKLADYGLTKLDDVMKAAGQVTGPDGIVNQLKERAISNANPVDLGGVMQIAKDAVSNEPLINGTTTAKNFLNIVRGGVYNSVGDTPGGGDPLKVFKLVKDLEGQAADIGSGNASKTEQSLAKVYRSVANELKDRLFNDAAADTKIPPLAPEQYQALNQISPQLAKDVASATTIKQLRSIEAPFVRGNIMGEKSLNRANNAPISGGDLISGLIGTHLAGPGGGLAGLIGRHFLGSNTGKAMIGNTLRGSGDVLNNADNVMSNPLLMKILAPLIGGQAGRN